MCKKADDILSDFYKYCENKECDRICDREKKKKNERCFAEYVANEYEIKDCLLVDGVITEKDLKLTAKQIEDLFSDWLDSFGLEFEGGTNYGKIDEE